MFTLIKNADIYTPAPIGTGDILLCNDRVITVGGKIEFDYPGTRVIDAGGRKVIPGLIDQHVHVTGGGGESGFASRVPELMFSSVVEAGVTTIVGTLGTDSRTRSVENLFAKTKALNEEGVTAYCLTGAYEYPSPNLTGTVGNDIIFVNECIGCKLAISDHRSSNVSKQELVHLASEVRVAGLLSHKPGILTLHTGTDPVQLDMIMDIIRTTPIPAKHFRPSHVGRMIDAAAAFAKEGGYIDFTSDVDSSGVAAKLKEAIDKAPFDRITLSSDSNGSMPKWGPNQELIGITAAKMTSLYNCILALHKEQGVPFEKAICLITENVAKGLEIYPKKGCLSNESDADLLILDDDLSISWVIAKGKVLMEEKEIIVKGMYED